MSEERSSPAINLSVEQLHQKLVEQGIKRAYLINTDGRLRTSHAGEPLATVKALIEGSPDFADHEAVFIARDDNYPTVFFAFVHWTSRGLAQGGLRFSAYPTLADLLRDGLRLSRGMTRKNALAGLWWGGGKGIIAKTAAIEVNTDLQKPSVQREYLFEAYGRFTASLGGIYYTAEDIGTNTADMNAILRKNRFVTCIGEELGGSGNPSPLTARGVLKSIKASWGVLKGTEDLRGVRVALQGVGNVGGSLALLLAKEGVALTVADPNKNSIERTLAAIPGATAVDQDAIFDVDADIFVPCARGAQVNSSTIPRLKVELVCGAANNILDRPEDAEALRQRGILLIPDYVSNRMGIFNCADEWKGRQLEVDIEAAIQGIYSDTLEVLRRAKRDEVTPTQAAENWADEEARVDHPLFANRGKNLIERLAASDWIQKG